MFYRIIFLLLIVSSLSYRLFSVVHEHRLQKYTQNAARIKRFLRLHIVIKPLNNNKKINTINSLLCWSVILLMFIQTLSSHCKFGASQKWESACHISDFEIFFKGFAESPRVLRSLWMLNQYNLYCKTVNYCILSDVCTIKTAPHSTGSPQIWCIKSIKGWFTRPPDLFAGFCKV